MIECPLPSYFPKNTDDAAILIRFVGTAIGAPWGYSGFNYAIADQGLTAFPEMLGHGGEYAYGTSWLAFSDGPFNYDEEFYYWYNPAEDASLSLYARGVVGASSSQAIDFDYIAAYIDVPVTTNLKVNKSTRRGRFL